MQPGSEAEASRAINEQLMRQVFESHLRQHVDMSLWCLVRHAEHPREYAHRTTQYQWSSFQAGWQARDAEAQKLREALEKIAEAERAIKPKDSLGIALLRLDAALAEARDIARAALAGGEEGETE